MLAFNLLLTPFVLNLTDKLFFFFFFVGAKSDCFEVIVVSVAMGGWKVLSKVRL